MREKILVLGGSGFLGSNLCRYFVKKNYEVYSFDRSQFLPQEGVHFIRGDFFDDGNLESVVRERTASSMLSAQ